MIEPQLGGDGQRFTTAGALRGREQHLLFHADALEQSRAKLRVPGLVDFTRPGSGTREQRIEAGVILSRRREIDPGIVLCSWRAKRLGK